VRFPDAAGTASIEDVLGDLGRVEIDFDGAIRYRARAPTPGASFGADRALIMVFVPLLPERRVRRA
jgi:hypothetical protein